MAIYQAQAVGETDTTSVLLADRFYLGPDMTAKEAARQLMIWVVEENLHSLYDITIKSRLYLDADKYRKKD